MWQLKQSNNWKVGYLYVNRNPKEIKNNENRVALTPAGVHSLISVDIVFSSKQMLVSVQDLLMQTIKKQSELKLSLLLKPGLPSWSWK